jgi:hypothetical protein
MEYKTFIDLLKKGEKDTVDFKIQCEAFEGDNIIARAELAKDICALANNGNVSSYIIIGVSDDGKSYKSVTNKNLTDDRLQDFCKKAIFPPPKVKIIKKQWKRANPAHKGIEFTIIQVGPHIGQTFRISKEFINYNKRVCHRQNEVWITRNATTDLATPEEITLLCSKKPQKDEKLSATRREERERFKRSSIKEQKAMITEATKLILKEAGYSINSQEKGTSWILSSIEYSETYLVAYKLIGTVAMRIDVHNCGTSLTERDIKEIRHSVIYDEDYAEWSKQPENIRRLTRRRVHAIRRLWLKPILKSVPDERIARALFNSRRLGSYSHYFLPELSRRHVRSESDIIIKSSSELLILDKIKSQSEYVETLKQALEEAENNKTTLVKVKNDKK